MPKTPNSTRAPRNPTNRTGSTRSGGSAHVALIDQMAAEWHSAGRAPASVRALQAVAAHDPVLARLVLGTPAAPPSCPTPFDVLAHMRRARGQAEREEAAHVVRILLREAGSDPFVCRMLVQALVPGLVTVAGKLRWGRGGDWQDGAEFFSELLSTAWVVIVEWAGQDRPYAVLDLLSAIRCRMRRQLFRAKDSAERKLVRGGLDGRPDRPAGPEPDLERLTKLLIEARRDGMRADDAEVLYAHHVLGYSIAELAAMTGRDRRALYARRDRGRRRLCA